MTVALLAPSIDFPEFRTMGSRISIDDALLEEAMSVIGLDSRKATVEAGLRQLISDHKRRAALESLRGIGWEGDLDAMREGRLPGERR